jgi:hypothetical protein
MKKILYSLLYLLVISIGVSEAFPPFANGIIEFSRPVTPDYAGVVPPTFSGASKTPITIVVRTGGERWYPIEQTMVGVRPNTRIYVDIDELNRSGGKLIAYGLAGATIYERTVQRVIFGPVAPKELHYSIAGVSINKRDDGFLECLIYFTIQTSFGYTRHYEVTTLTQQPFERALAGTIVKSVKMVFADRQVAEFLKY